LLFEAICRHRKLNVLTVVRGPNWEEPALEEKGQRFPHTSLSDARIAFAADGTNLRGLVLNVDPYALLVLFKEGGEVKTLLVTTGHRIPTVPTKCNFHARLLAPETVAFTPITHVSHDAIERATLLGSAFHAFKSGVRFDSLVQTLETWTATLGNLSMSVGGHGPKSGCRHDASAMFNLVCAMSVSSYAAHNAVYDKRTNSAICLLFGLLVSTHKTTYKNPQRSALFCLEGAISFGCEGGAAKSLPGSLSFMDFALPGDPRKTITALSVKKMISTKDQIPTVLSTPTGTICLPLPRAFTRRQGLYELLRVLCELRNSKLMKKLGVDAYTLVPQEDLHAFNLTDLAVYFNDTALHWPFGGRIGYCARARESLSRVVCDLLPRALIDIIGSYVTSAPVDFPSPCSNAALDVTLGASVSYDSSMRGQVFFSIGRTAAGLYSTNAALSPVTFIVEDRRGVSATTKICNDFVEMSQISPIAARQCGPADHRGYLLEQRFLRAPVVMILSIGDHLISFPQSGTVGAFLSARLSMTEVFGRVLGAYVEFLLGDDRDPMSCGDRGRSRAMGNPFDDSTVSALARHIPTTLRMSATLLIHTVLPPMELIEPPLEQTLYENMRHLIASDIVAKLPLGSYDVYTQQAAIKMLNNHFILLRSIKKVMYPFVEELARQLRAFTAEEDRKIRDRVEGAPSSFSTPFPALSLPHGFICLGDDVEVIPWVCKLLQLPITAAHRIVGAYRLVCDRFRYRDVFDENATGKLGMSVSSPVRTVADFRGDELVQCIAEPCHRDDFTALAKWVSEWTFWCLPVDPNSFNGSIATACDYLQISASVCIREVPSFTLGAQPVVCTSMGARSSVPYFEGIDLNDAAMWVRLVRVFHEHAGLAVALALEQLGKEAKLAVKPSPQPNLAIHLPQLFNHNPRTLSCMSNCEFDIVADPEPLKRLLDMWGCTTKIHRSGVRLAVVDVCSDSMPPSVLGDILDFMPDCLMDGAGVRQKIATPVRVPHGTPLALLNLAVHLRLVQCGCEGCTRMIGVGDWSVGEVVRKVYADTDFQTDPLKLQCGFISGQEPTLYQLPSQKKLIDCPEIQRVLACVPPEGAKYLQTARFYLRHSREAFLAMHICFDDISIICDVSARAMPLLPRELRFHCNSRVRFVWAPEGGEGTSVTRAKKRNTGGRSGAAGSGSSKRWRV
jgi:hypothetical protein